jgi:hypothetical protein
MGLIRWMVCWEATRGERNVCSRVSWYQTKPRRGKGISYKGANRGIKEVKKIA